MENSADVSGVLRYRGLQNSNGTALGGTMTGQRICRSLFGLLAILAAVQMSAQPGGFGAAHSSVSLISERDALVPGETAMLGLLFEFEDGLHIYQASQNYTGL